MDPPFERHTPIFRSFYLTTHFLLLEGNLTECKRKQTGEGGEKRVWSKRPLLFRTKREEKALFLHKASEREVPQSRVFPYCSGRYNRAVSWHPYCV